MFSGEATRQPSSSCGGWRYVGSEFVVDGNWFGVQLESAPRHTINRADRRSSLDPRRNIVVITGDHGEAFGEGDHFGHVNIYGKTPTHTPLILWGQGVPSGSSAARPTCHTDVMPTVFALLGAPRRQLQTLPGRDLLSTLPHEAARHSQRFFFSVSRSTFASKVLLVSKQRRLLVLMDRKEPRVVPLQFQGPEGEILAEQPTDADIDDFRRLFRELQ